MYKVIIICESLHGSEGLKLHLKQLVDNIYGRDYGETGMGIPYPPHVIISFKVHLKERR